MNKEYTVGQYLVDRLHQLGLEHLFSIAGDYSIEWVNGYVAPSNIQVIEEVNELNAGYAADGYARLSHNGIQFRCAIQPCLRRRTRVSTEKGDRHLLAPTAAQRKQTVGILVRPHLQPIKILRLRAESRVGDFDVVAAVLGKLEIESRIKARAGAIVGARQLLARLADRQRLYEVDKEQSVLTFRLLNLDDMGNPTEELVEVNR